MESKVDHKTWKFRQIFFCYGKPVAFFIICFIYALYAAYCKYKQINRLINLIGLSVQACWTWLFLWQIRKCIGKIWTLYIKPNETKANTCKMCVYLQLGANWSVMSPNHCFLKLRIKFSVVRLDSWTCMLGPSKSFKFEKTKNIPYVYFLINVQIPNKRCLFNAPRACIFGDVKNVPLFVCVQQQVWMR